jgi:hypothetical protein
MERATDPRLDLLDSVVGEIRDALLVHCCVKSLFKARLGEESVNIFKSESLGFCERKYVSNRIENIECRVKAYQDRRST